MPQPERVAYFNGQILPESQVLIPFRDRGFIYGDGIFDTARTFGGRVFKLREHITRLYQSLKYVAIDPVLTPDEMTTITQEVIERNLPLLAEGEDYWVTQRVSRGLDPARSDGHKDGGPTVIVECTPLPLKARASLYRDGISVIFPSVRRTPPEALSPNVKSHNYLNMIVADLEVRSYNPNAWAVLLDTRGFLAEGLGSNIFLVKDRVLYTPKSQYVLAGISRATVIELAAQLQLNVVEDDLSPYDAYNADEAFITSTSLCLCPVHTFNNKVVGAGQVPGEITRELSTAFSEMYDIDFVEQYLCHLSD